jgi:hypothetical protein
LILTLLWSGQTNLAAIFSPILGLFSGLATWLALSWFWSGGVINIETTQAQLPGLYGAIVSFFSPALYSVIISLIWPSTFDWREFLRINLIEDKSQTNSSLQSEAPSSEAVNESPGVEESSEKALRKESGQEFSEKVIQKESSGQRLTSPNSKVSLDDTVHPFDEETLKHIRRWFKIASGYFVLNVLVTIVLWPIPMYRDWIFTKSFFNGWITMAIIWHFAAIFAVIIYPIYDGRHAIAKAARGITNELKRRK